MLGIRSMMAVLSVSVLLPLPGRADEPPARAGRIVVRYAPSLDVCVPCLTAGRSPRATVSGSDSFAALHAELGVRGARRLFADRKPGGVGAGSRLAARAARASHGVASPDLRDVYVLEIAPEVDVHEAARRYAADPDVLWAHPDYIRQVSLLPNDPFLASSGTWSQPYADLWGLHQTDAPSAWDVSNGTGITVAVVDSGVDRTHPDLAANLWMNPGEIPGNAIDDDANGYVDDVAGWDFADGDADPTDDHGHGTHVAGTVASVGNDGLGVLGMAWGATIMPVRGFDATGQATTSTLAEAIVYAVDNGADVINASFGGAGQTPLMMDAVAAAIAGGVVFVAAAGNDGADVDHYEPAGLPGVIAVSASTPNDVPAYFTNHGDAISVAAPGVDILSLAASGAPLGQIVGGQWSRLQGTSMAAPHVAGLAALLLADQPALSQEEVRWHLELNADQVGIPGYEGDPWNPQLGYGRINAANVFDPPPVTARLRPRRSARHVYEGAGGAYTTLALSFTTHDSVDWSLSVPSWISAAPSNGSGGMPVALSFETSGLSAGETHVADLTVDSPAIAWSEALETTLHVHRDVRLGGEIAIDEDDASVAVTTGAPVPIRAASNGTEAMVVWYNHKNDWLYGAIVSAGGLEAGPFLVTASRPRWWFDIASDGESFFVVWIENPDNFPEQKVERRIMGRRFDTTGQSPDPEPIPIDVREYRPYQLAYYPFVAFDGSDYVVVWQRRKVNTIRNKPWRTWVYLRRIATDGTPWRRRKRISTRRSRSTSGVQDAAFACRQGSCLFTWRQAFTQYAVPVIGEKPQYRDLQPVLAGFEETFTVQDLVTDGNGYLLVGRDSGPCSGSGISFAPLECEWLVRAIRIGPNAEQVDTQRIAINQGSPGLMPRRGEASAVFDGTNYLVSFNAPRRHDDEGTGGGPVFLARLDASGAVLDDEQEGLLVSPAASAGSSSVVMVGGQPMVLYLDTRNAETSSNTFPAFGSVYAQRVAP